MTKLTLDDGLYGLNTLISIMGAIFFALAVAVILTRHAVLSQYEEEVTIKELKPAPWVYWFAIVLSSTVYCLGIFGCLTVWLRKSVMSSIYLLLYVLTIIACLVLMSVSAAGLARLNQMDGYNKIRAALNNYEFLMAIESELKCCGLDGNSQYSMCGQRAGGKSWGCVDALKAPVIGAWLMLMLPSLFSMLLMAAGGVLVIRNRFNNKEPVRNRNPERTTY